MKIGFSFTKKTEVRQNVGVQIKETDPNVKTEVVKDIEGGKLTLENPVEEEGPLVIPCQNSLKRKKQIDVEAATDAEKKKRKEELQQRLAGLNEADKEAALKLLKASGEDISEDEEAMPIMMQSQFHGLRQQGGTEKQMLQREEALLPEASKDQFEAVPVEQFGMALLRGMGYKPKEDKNKPVLLARRAGLAGLGATGLLPGEKPADQLPGEKEKEEKKKEEAAKANNAATSTSSSWRPPQVGTAIPGRIMLGYVKPPAEESNRSEAAQGDVPSSSSSAPAPKERTRSNSENPRSDIDGKEQSESKKLKVEKNPTKPVSAKETWLSRGLVVKMVNERDRWFCCRAVVLKVDEATGRVKLKARKTEDSPSEVVEDYNPEYLETIVSRDAEQVRVVAGPLKGEECKVLERDAKKGRVHVRAQGTPKWLEFDDVCEFL